MSLPKIHTLAFACLFSGFCQSAYASVADNFSFSGFGRIAAGYLDTDQAEFKGYSDAISLKPDSLLGLQANYQFSDDLTLTAQGVLRSSDTEDSGLEWLYLTWLLDDNLTVRLGRQRGPFFLYSDSIDIGYAYPWVNLPYQIYSGYIFPTYDGLDATWGYSTQEFDFTLQGYAGYYPGGDLNIFGGTTDYELKAVAGVIAKVKHNNTELRLSRYRGNPKLNVTSLDYFRTLVAGSDEALDALKTEGWGSITQIGISYDSMSQFYRAEWMKSESDIKYMVPVVEAYFISGGFYVDAFTYHLTYSESKTTYNTYTGDSAATLAPVFSQLTKDNLRSWTAGVRWDFRKNMALKFDVTLLDGNENENSFYDSPQTGFDRDATLYLIAIDWVF